MVYTDGIEANGVFFQRLRELTRFLCLAGFDSAEEVRERVEEVAEEAIEDGEMEDDPDIGRVEQLVTEELALKAAYEKTFPEITDCRRLTAAFEALTAQGIIAIEKAGWDTSESWYRFHDIVAAWREQGAVSTLRGGCFYHEQDLTRAINEGRLWIGFGHVEEGHELAAALGQEIVEELRRHGLTVQWNGNPETRPEVALKWQRRHAPPACTDPPTELCTFEPLPEEPPAHRDFAQ